MVKYLWCQVIFVFFFNATATTAIYTLSLHDALPILSGDPHYEIAPLLSNRWDEAVASGDLRSAVRRRFHTADRKSTRLNSSHPSISYAVFCLKKKKKTTRTHRPNTRTS